MLLSSLTLYNFKSFRGEHKFQLNRPPGVYNVTGENKVERDLEANGAGKSSLWDGVVWIVTGRTVRAARPGASVECRRTKGPAGGYFLFQNEQGRKLYVLRERRPNRLAIGPSLDDLKDVEQPELERALGISGEMLLKTLILGQFGTLFLDMRPEAQLSLLSEALGLDAWLAASQNATKRAQVVQAKLKPFQEDASRVDGRLQELHLAEQELQRLVEDYAAEKVIRLETATGKLRRAKDALAAVPAGPAKGVQRHQARLAELGSEIAQARAAKNRAQSRLSACQTEYQMAKAAEGRLVARLEQYQKSRKTRTCPECGQPVADKHLAQNEANVTKELEVTRRQLVSLADEGKERRKKETAAVEALNKLEIEEDNLERELQDASRQANRTTLARQDCQHAVDAAQTELDRIHKETNPHTERLEDTRARLAKMGKTRKQLARDIVALESEIEGLELWAKGFKEIRLRELEEALSELELSVNQHAEGLGLHSWYMRFATERETKSGSISAGLHITVQPPDTDEPMPWESYSGGEGQRWQLASSFGLSEVLLGRAGVSVNLEVLDEPTQHLSRQGIDDLLDHLTERARELGRAIYLTDHRMLDRGAFDGVIRIVKDKNGSHIEEL